MPDSVVSNQYNADGSSNSVLANGTVTTTAPGTNSQTGGPSWQGGDGEMWTSGPNGPTHVPKPTVAATSTSTRNDITNLGTDISNQLNDGTFAKLFPTPDTTGLTDAYNTQQTNAANEETALQAERDNALKDINSNFDTQKTTLGTNQLNETGHQSNTLARIGGYLGDSAGGQGAMLKLDQTHQQQMTALENKRQAAINLAKVAYSNKSIAAAKALATEAAAYQKEMLQQTKDYNDTKFKYLNEIKSQQAQQFKEDTATLAQQAKAKTFATQHNIQQPFYKIGETVFNSASGMAYATPDEYMKAGGKPDYSNVQTVETKGDTYAIVQKGIVGPDGKPHDYRITYDAQGKPISQEDVGQVYQKPVKGKGGSGTPTSAPAGVDSKQYAAVQRIIKANPGEYGHAADAIDKQFGKGTAQKFDGQLKTAYLVPAHAKDVGASAPTNLTADQRGAAKAKFISDHPYAPDKAAQEFERFVPKAKSSKTSNTISVK